MRSRIVLAAAVAVLACAWPSFAATAPFGTLDPRILPINGNATFGVMNGTGWACDDSGIASVDIFVDGTPDVRASINRRRPGVTRKFPTCTTPGFVFAVDTTRYLNGVHQVTAVATGRDGGQSTLGPVTVQFLNAEHMLKPFGQILFPDADTVMHGRCNIADPTRRYSVVEGVAFDAGVNFDEAGVHNVDLLIDGSMVARTKTDCAYVAAQGGWSDCYGLTRAGWTTIYPTLPDSDRPEFRFVLDVGALLNIGYQEGGHVLSVRADDIYGNYAILDKVNVFFQCDEDVPNEPAFGHIDTPTNSQPYAGVITVAGWALDITGIAPNGIEIRVNDNLDGTTNPTILRPDVADLYPGYPVLNSGWTYQLDTRKYNDGPVTIEVWVTDVLGQRTLIGEQQIILSNQVGP